MEHVTQVWAEMSMTLTSLADGANLLLTVVAYQEAAANVTEHYGLPLAALHYVPMRTHVTAECPGPQAQRQRAVRCVTAHGRRCATARRRALRRAAGVP